MKVAVLLLVFCCFFASLSARTTERERERERERGNTVVMLNDNQLTSSDAKEEREMEEEWENFKQQYHKTYTTQEEEKKRQKIFRENVKGLEERKKKYSPLMKAGITRFYDLTLDEFKQQTSGLGPLKSKAKEVREKEREREREREEATPTLSDYPMSWDWEEKGDVTPVKNEGQCGSTWAISAIDVMESACSIAGYPLIPLSTQMVIDCNHYSEGCEGGLPQVVYDVVLRLGGIESDQSYPYIGPNGTSKCHAQKSKFVHCKLSTYINITTDKSETLFLKYIYKQSPLVVCLEAGQEAFMDYKGGVLTAKDCPGTLADHCVALVGWVNIGGKRVWKVKNQWGTDWGEKGYAYLEMGSNTCGMDSDYSCLPVVVPN